MGRGKSYSLHEIAETKAAAREEEFEEILDKIKAAGTKIDQDETHPLYTEVGEQEFEIGTERIIEFNIRNLDFKLIRKVEDYILQGSGHQKHIEELEISKVYITLKRKESSSDRWETVDLEDML